MSPVSRILRDPLTAGLEQVLDLRRVQHTLTASNVANAETPGFRARALPFERLLAEVVGRALAGEPVDAEAEARAALYEVEPPPTRLDGNSVDAEAEALSLAENALLYNAVSGGLSRRLGLLRFAASDGRS